jgi:alkylhydroperoxidase/carboxymuconolactone decarboxylase family protein YurZ
MINRPRPPKAHEDFVRRFPQLGRAWELAGEAALRGPLDEKAARLVKLGIALGSMREGAVHSAVRKALASGASRDEIEQVVALAATTLGFPATVAVDSWVRDLLARREPKPRKRRGPTST